MAILELLVEYKAARKAWLHYRKAWLDYKFGEAGYDEHRNLVAAARMDTAYLANLIAITMTYGDDEELA